uniref:BTB domain-containing protein n=1 Tax=Macrostomum lignano TaxID=282301 RepID=A0A1I8FGW4_9PLAT
AAAAAVAAAGEPNRHQCWRSPFRDLQIHSAEHPDTRLAWLAEATSVNSADFDPDTGEYFFDRHSGVFAMILNYYRTGRLHTPWTSAAPCSRRSWPYWGIDEKQMESCCWTTYRTHRDASGDPRRAQRRELSDDGEEDAPGDTARRFRHRGGRRAELLAGGSGSGEGLGAARRSRVPALRARQGAGHSIRSFIWSLPSSPWWLETLPEARIPRPGAGAMNCSRLMVSDCLRYTQPRPAVHAVDITVTAYFALELAARLPEFFKSALNWIDLVAVATACVSFAVRAGISRYRAPDSQGAQNFCGIFKADQALLRLKILVHTMKASSRELTLLGTVFAIFVILCGTAIFICEQFVESARKRVFEPSLSDSVWRYIVGGVCAISGVPGHRPASAQSLSTTSPCTTRTPRPAEAAKEEEATAGAVIVGCGDGDGDGGCISGGGGNGCGSEHQLSCSDSGEETPSVSEELDLSPEGRHSGTDRLPRVRQPSVLHAGQSRIEVSDEVPGGAAARKPERWKSLRLQESNDRRSTSNCSNSSTHTESPGLRQQFQPGTPDYCEEPASGPMATCQPDDQNLSSAR